MARRRVANPKTYRLTDAEKPWPHFLYRLFAEDGTLLYVGVTEEVEHRVYMHLATATTTRWLEIQTHYHHHDSTEYPNLLAAREAERQAIAEQAPVLNRQHNPKRWRRLDGHWVWVGEPSRYAEPSVAAWVRARAAA